MGRSPQLGGRLCYKVKRIGVVRDQDMAVMIASLNRLLFFDNALSVTTAQTSLDVRSNDAELL